MQSEEDPSHSEAREDICGYEGAIWRQKNFFSCNGPDHPNVATYPAPLQDVVEDTYPVEERLAESCVFVNDHDDSPRKVFQSKRNSKRNIHIYRFLRKVLGRDFPIPDSMCGVLKYYLECKCKNGMRFVAKL